MIPTHSPNPPEMQPGKPLATPPVGLPIHQAVKFRRNGQPVKLRFSENPEVHLAGRLTLFYY